MFIIFIVAYKELRVALIKEEFKRITSIWDKNFVLYPLSSQEDIQICM
jgi:hypothetical protein